MEQTVALIGFGEAGSTFARAAGWRSAARGWDPLPERRAAMAACGIKDVGSAKDALDGAGLVLSLVTADRALLAAQNYAALVSAGALWCDMNSVAPETKRAAASAIEAQGGRYVDVAVLAPVDPARLGVPLLLAGPAANEAEAALRQAGFSNVRAVGAEVGEDSLGDGQGHRGADSGNDAGLPTGRRDR
jgi:3-hydroxyisobutyrate dehydrogenase-like beta-hydroxyacid dehydrogenase